jgi:hypothetical protein
MNLCEKIWVSANNDFLALRERRGFLQGVKKDLLVAGKMT